MYGCMSGCSSFILKQIAHLKIFFHSNIFKQNITGTFGVGTFQHVEKNLLFFSGVFSK